jgi:hypothetical protein
MLRNCAVLKTTGFDFMRFELKRKLMVEFAGLV